LARTRRGYALALAARRRILPHYSELDLFTGGRDRAVARAAFSSHLPADIVWRRGKGRLESLCGAAYLAQREALRELLLGGRLAEQGLLDRPRIEAYLGRDLVEGDFDYFRLIEIGDVERWVRAAEAGFAPSFDQR
jgi:asparagine synthase (glutamine-hydrolysing)